MDETEFNDSAKRPFHPAEPPYGSTNYDFHALEPEQKEALNEKKILQRRENEMYFNRHPEIRGLVSMILRHMLEKKPKDKDKMQELVGEYFSRPRREIISNLLDYFIEVRYEGALVDDLKKEVYVEEPSIQLLDDDKCGDEVMSKSATTMTAERVTTPTTGRLTTPTTGRETIPTTGRATTPTTERETTPTTGRTSMTARTTDDRQ